METIGIYSIGSAQYELYQTAGGGYCVTVKEYGKESEHYIYSSKETALEFILSDYEAEPEEHETCVIFSL